MPDLEVSPYATELNGSINGKPRTIQLDVREVLRERFEREGRVVTAEELNDESSKLLHDINRTKDAAAVDPAKFSITAMIATAFKK